MKSSTPDKIEIQALLYDKGLKKKFSTDVRKFSRSYEGSFFFNEYNAGASYDSNVIFSTSSYIPRTAMLNLTVNLFGESTNLFEMTGRMEGFEHFFESMFGPKGPVANLKEKMSKLRVRRKANNAENEILKSEISKLPNIMENKINDPKISLGIKVFGNEIKYIKYDGKEEIGQAVNKLNPIDNLKKIFAGKNINFNRATMFLDTSYIIPTGTGFPLVLNAIGTSGANLKLYGSLKGANFTQDKKLSIIGSFRPR